MTTNAIRPIESRASSINRAKKPYVDGYYFLTHDVYTQLPSKMQYLERFNVIPLFNRAPVYEGCQNNVLAGKQGQNAPICDLCQRPDSSATKALS